MPSYLPLLLNPLLNALFNNPEPEKSPLLGIYAKLATDHHGNDNVDENGTTIILVPSLHKLLNYSDADTGLAYKDLCYSEEFLKDHIITTTEQHNAKIYTTLNNKEILIKKDTLFTGKGFKKSLVVKVLKYGTFQSFNDYLPRGKRFMICYIESPILGTPIDSMIYDSIMNSKNNETATGSNKDLPPIIEQRQRTSLEKTEEIIQEEIKFEQIIRNYPLISSKIGQQYQYLFTNFNVRDVHDTSSLIEVFQQSINLSSHIFQALPDELVEVIYRAADDDINLNSCVYHYVEMNLFDKIWNGLCGLIPDFLENEYKDLEHLSINQISLSEKLKNDLTKISSLEKAIAKAVTEFKKLTLSCDYQSKVKIITQTVQILSNANSVVVDADTLVGLLLLVIIRSNVPFLEAHLFYVSNFSFDKMELGIIGYSLSTFEAVIYFLKNKENLEMLKKYSMTNRKVFGFIDQKELLLLKRFLDGEVLNLNAESSIRARTQYGESLLTLAIQSNDYDTWKLIVDYEKFFPLEDLLSDMTITNSNLLNIALNSENFEIIDDLTEILLSSCTLRELKLFLNLKDDTHQRTIGHYLFHYKDLIPSLGKFIDWRIKDINGQTPLFAICRSYDTPNYSNLIKTVFDVVVGWYASNGSSFDYADHIDYRGNTLLHILNSNIEHLLKLEKLNVNEANLKSYTPLMIFVKYNRLENITKILQESELIDISKTDKNFFTCLDHSRNSKVSEIIDSYYLKRRIIPIKERSIAIIRVKLDHNNWNLIIRGKIKNQQYEVNHTFIEFKQFLDLLKLEINSSTSFLPIDYIANEFSRLVLNIPGFSKLRLNNLIDEINVFFQAMMLYDDLGNEGGLMFTFLKNKGFQFAEVTQSLKLKALEKKEAILKIKQPGEMNGGNLHNNHFFLQPEEISEINFFLKFSSKEVSKFNHCFDRLFKVATFTSVKQKELCDAYMLFVNKTSGMADSNFKELDFLRKIIFEFNKEFQFNGDVCNELLLLSLSTNSFVTKINGLVNSKIFRWWKLYQELIELNNNYKKFKAVEMKRTKHHNHDQDDFNINGVIEIREESFNDFTNTNNSFRQSAEHEMEGKRAKKTSQTSVGSPSFLVNFVESKRQKFETKLLDGLKTVKDSLVELNKDIKYNHELIAMELNSFMTFKNEFLKIILLRYVKNEIRDLKFKNLMLKRSLDDLRAVAKLEHLD